MNEIKGTPISDSELLEIFGPRIIEVGKCFRKGSHFYMQREHDVLHVSEGQLINTLFEGHLNSVPDKEEMPKEKFEMRVKEAIYLMQIDHFWK